MGIEACHVEHSPRAIAKTEVMRLGVKHVADWCDLSEAAVYQWFTRATDERPLPEKYVGKIVRGARLAGKPVDVKALWPEAPEVAA